jgi:hypothetical protein
LKTALLFLALISSVYAEDDTATWNALAQSIEQRALGSRYPWHREIGTTIFWVFELPHRGDPGNLRSAWDSQWLLTAPRQNPFYVALPFNDIDVRDHTKPEAWTVIPWFRSAFIRDGRSVCKDRWVAIRHANKVCYARWEDVGPFQTDHWRYVFGNERPRPNRNGNAGLEVSPAVRDYLGLNTLDCCDWRFVEARSVPPGPWRALPELF